MEIRDALSMLLLINRIIVMALSQTNKKEKYGYSFSIGEEITLAPRAVCEYNVDTKGHCVNF